MVIIRFVVAVVPVVVDVVPQHVVFAGVRIGGKVVFLMVVMAVVVVVVDSVVVVGSSELLGTACCP